MGECLWRAHGVWEWDEKNKTARIRDGDYFEVDHRPGREGKPIEWYNDCYAPFLQKFTERVSCKKAKQFSFIEPIPNEFIPPWPTQDPDNKKWLRQKYAEKEVIKVPRPQNFVYAPHFYDLNVLFSKSHSWMSVNVQGLTRGMFVLNALYFGVAGLRHNYRRQLGNIVNYGKQSLGKVPTVIGEIGLSYDINKAEAFRTGCYDTQRNLMNGLISAMEDNKLNYTLWNYNPNNRVEYGDGWNNEDFSVINGDEVSENGPVRPDYRNHLHEHDELYKGGRILDVIIRPYAVKTAGIPKKSNWNHKSLRFEYEWTSTATKEPVDEKTHLTEIFIPAYHYDAHKLRVRGTNVEWTYDKPRQTLYVRSSLAGYHSIIVAIENEAQHLLERGRRRRELYPPQFPFNLVSPGVEDLIEDVDWSKMFAYLPVVVVILIAFFMTPLTSWLL